VAETLWLVATGLGIVADAGGLLVTLLVQRPTLQKLTLEIRELEARLEKMVGDAHLEARLADLRGRLELLQKTGRARTEAWRGKADSFRAEALERMVDIQGKVVSFLGVATREQVRELHRELERLAKRVESGHKARPARKSASKAEMKA